jgi:hypothetical protein
MKLTRSRLRKLIKEEVSQLIEMQVGLGLPHEFSNEQLYQHAMMFASQNPRIEDPSPQYDQADGLLRILDNRIKSAGVFHQGTSEEEMVYAREIQAKLSMVRRALVQAMGESWRYSGMSRARKDFYRN